MKNKLGFGGIFTITCVDKDGNIKWVEKTKNKVVNVALEHILDLVFSLNSETVNANYYVGLIDSSPVIAATDTLSSHSGWNESTPYSETSRHEYIEARSSLTVSNSSTKAEFTINSSATIGGVFITSDSLGTSGLLFSAAPFGTGDKDVNTGDTIFAVYEFTSTSS